jgi:hypothetical protein
VPPLEQKSGSFEKPDNASSIGKHHGNLSAGHPGPDNRHINLTASE